MQAQEPRINVCEHVRSQDRAAEFLLGHRGFTLVALCAFCEVRFRQNDDAVDSLGEAAFAVHDNFAGISTTPLSIPEAGKLNIPEKVGAFDDEMCVYGR